MSERPRLLRTILLVLLALAGLTACDETAGSYWRECHVRFSKARTAADTLAILDKPQGPRGIYCGAYLDQVKP